MRGWTCTEEAALKVLAPLGGRACALTFDRSAKSVERKAARLGISLKRRKLWGKTGGTVTPATLRRVRELQSASLCPDCGFNFAAVPSTGLCTMCHFKRLKAVHEEEIKKADAQRELWKVRSKLYRRRRALVEAQRLSETETGDGSATMDVQDASDPRRSACTR